MCAKLSVGDIVFIHPRASMRFAGKWGKLVALNGSRDGCTVSFREGGYGFRFSRDEVIRLPNYMNILLNCDSGYIRHLPTSADYKLTSISAGDKPNTLKLGNITAHITELYPVMSCSVCGTDTTDEFSHTCMDCSHPIN